MALEDTQALALKNLLYELDHYRRTTRAVESFQTAYPDLEVLSLEEFMLQSGVETDRQRGEPIVMMCRFEIDDGVPCCGTLLRR